MMWCSTFKTKLKHAIAGRRQPATLLCGGHVSSSATSGMIAGGETCHSRRDGKCVGTKGLCIMVGTWNVAGKLPPPDLDLDKWLNADYHPDIYVLGFQEIVPLNASNVLGVEDRRPAQVWKAIIARTLNKKQHDKSSKVFRGRNLFRSATWSAIKDPLESTQIDYKWPKLSRSQEETQSISFVAKGLKPLGLDCNNSNRTTCTKECDFEKTQHLINMSRSLPMETPASLAPGSDYTTYNATKLRWPRYVQVVSEQMVGIHIFIWAKKTLKHHIKNIMVSQVGTGVLGYLGNKGAISVSMNVCGCNYCFVCSHLSAGEKQVDNDNRSVDVIDILKRTRFVRAPIRNKLFSRRRNNDSSEQFPKHILEHDNIIWFGDLNYRINNISDEDIQFLVAREEWDTLLEKDQLKREFSEGKVFKGWKEGDIRFAPTYKYEPNSDKYNLGHSRVKRRKPAWCDRILWRGENLRLLLYTRVESILSDHKPVKAILLAKNI